MNTKQILIAARDLLSDPKRWIKGAMARDHKARIVATFDASACSWCIMGALCKCSKRDYSIIGAASDLIMKVGRISCIPQWQDSTKTTHEDVINVLNKSIELCPN